MINESLKKRNNCFENILQTKESLFYSYNMKENSFHIWIQGN